jgi:hypothetical protein
MSNSSDATPAYRGYRRQALYALFRIFESSNADHVFQPEGAEDFTIFDTAGNLIEVVQVKSYGSNLTLSDFKPNKKDSFFYRVAALLKSNPGVHVAIASFGTLGPELDQALATDGKDRDRVARKLSGYGFISDDDARTLLEETHPSLVDEAHITNRVMSTLKSTLPLVDAEAAFGLLQNWLSLCSEYKTKITQQDVIDQVNGVGKFVVERAEHHGQWITTIAPIAEHELDEQAKEELADEFYQGVSTRYDHVLAGLDVVRSTKLEEITRKFQSARVVVIHGASGQGKTTLAYRYLHEHFPNEWRFQVKRVENKQHALSIATALIGHADALKMPIAVYLDVAASDRDWPELVQQLATHRNIRVLVTIREEDFQRSSITGATVPFERVNLLFEEAEARELYEALAQRQEAVQFLSFDEAWRRFGGAGPLMEFVYLVTQGNLLREKLAEQVARLEEDAAKGDLGTHELALLRLVSVASAFDARLRVKPLVESLSLALPKRTFRYFEKEYLLRLSDDGSLVYGLHPIRSAMLCDLLTDPSLDSWIDNARSCLPIMYEPDVEIFLLYAFSRRKPESHHLVSALAAYQTNQWSALAGVTRALIWLGVREYVDANRDVIREAHADSGKGWYVFLDYDIADAMPGVAAKNWETLSSMVSEERRQKIEGLQRRQADKKEVFRFAKEWLESRSQKPAQPATDAEWSAMGEALFWVGRLEVSWPFHEWLAEGSFDLAVDTLPIEVLGDVILGLSEGHIGFLSSFMEAQRPRIAARFRQSTQTIVLEDDGQKVMAHFVVEIEPSSGTQSILEARVRAAKDRFHEEAIIRIALLRRLFPDRELYACQGYGHQLWGELPSDSTTKTGVNRDYLPPLWLTSVNSTFRGLAEREFRPHTWPEYVQILFDMRRDAIIALTEFVGAAEQYFRSQQFVSVWGNLIEANSWASCAHHFSHPVALPASALDEWGLVDENATEPVSLEMRERAPVVGRNGLAFQAHKRFLDAFRSYAYSLGNFFEQSVHVMVVNPSLGRNAKDGAARARVLAFAEEQGIKTDLAHMSTYNFADAVKALPQFQREFRHLLSEFVDSEELGRIERQERHLYRQSWYFWYFFANQPQRTTPNPHSLIREATDSIQRIRTALLKEFRRFSKGGVQVRIASEEVLWEFSPALWITVDSDNPLTVYEAFEQVLDAIRQAVKKARETELRRYVLDFNWPYVVVVPLVQGKLLIPAAWRLYLPVLLQEDELKWWNYHQTNIPADAVAELGLSTWDHPRLEPALKFLGGTTALSLYAAHIGDFLKMPEVDEEGIGQLQAYLEQTKSQLEEAFQTALDAGSVIADTFNQLSPDEQATRTHLLSAVQALVEMQGALLPTDSFDGQVSLTVTELGEWAERLKKAREYAALVYFYWVSDVLSNTTTDMG